FEHPTLSETPRQNALWFFENLVKKLPPKSALKLDVISHSRGGLVGRVLCERPADLGQGSSALEIQKLVMVATPNAGTALADPQHMEAFLDLVTNLFGLLPDNPIT